MRNYLPSDITNKALRDTYYVVQDIIAAHYEEALKCAVDKDSKCTIVENFKAQLRDTITYYVELSR